MTSPRDAAFDALLDSYQLVTPLLDADREAAGGRKQYDDAYFEAFLAKASRYSNAACPSNHGEASTHPRRVGAAGTLPGQKGRPVRASQ